MLSEENTGTMSQIGLESFGAYQKARQLFDLVVTDMEVLKTNPICYRLVSQQIGSADSICANTTERSMSAFSISYGALPVKQEGDTNGLDTGSRRR